MRRPTALPLGRPRHELVLPGLVAAVALPPVYPINTEDVSRLCLTHALVDGRFTVDDCVTEYTVDGASYGRHGCSGKAPGMSALELPAAQAIGVPRPPEWLWEDLRLRGVRVRSSGLALPACSFLAGCATEGIAPGRGAAAIAALVDDHVALRRGRRAYDDVRRLLPGAALLWTYDRIAFGAPWDAAVYYADDGPEQQRAGAPGVGLPRAESRWPTFLGSRGLLVVSPVLAAAACGLRPLRRRGFGAEALLCASPTVVFLVAEFGRFLPDGGLSPGPRFFVPALPLLALGLGPAFARFPRATPALAGASAVAATASLLAWASMDGSRQAIWGRPARVPPQLGRSRVADDLASNLAVSAGAGRGLAAVLVAAGAAAALAVAARSAR